MNQRAGKTHAAALRDGESIKLGQLIKFCKDAQRDLEKAGEEDSALRFEILSQALLEDFKGGSLSYNSKMIGL
jgi:hypothetical protein